MRRGNQIKVIEIDSHRDVETRNIREATQTVRFYWCRTRVQDFYLQQTPGEIYTYIQ